MTQPSPSRRPGRRKSIRLSLDDEIAHLRSLNQTGLQARWQSILGRPAPPHLPKHLVFGILAYRIQADALGDIDAATVQLLTRAAAVQTDKGRIYRIKDGKAPAAAAPVKQAA